MNKLLLSVSREQLDAAGKAVADRMADEQAAIERAKRDPTK